MTISHIKGRCISAFITITDTYIIIIIITTVINSSFTNIIITDVIISNKHTAGTKMTSGIKHAGYNMAQVNAVTELASTGAPSMRRGEIGLRKLAALNVGR